MTRGVSDGHPLHRLFRGLTEHAFMTELGIGDPRLVGYVSELLVRFVPTEGVYRVRDAEGRPVKEVAAMLQEAERAGSDERRRECLRHVGDFTLFWTGVFPEALRGRAARDSGDDLIDYQRQGKRSYYLASTFAADEESPLLRRLSAEFELCAFGLSRVRKEWELLPATEAGRAGRPRLEN